MEKSDIERIANSVRTNLQAEGVPTDLDLILKTEGIARIPGDFNGEFDGRIEYRPNHREHRFFILHARSNRAGQNEGRVRFSIAHELGHYFLPAHREFLVNGNLHGSVNGFVSERRTEREADYFATCLLMPRGPFMEIVNGYPGEFLTLANLVELASGRFKASITSTVLRYVELSVEPCCAILSKSGLVLFSIQSYDFQAKKLGWLPRGQELSTKTMAGNRARLGRSNDTQEGQSCSTEWFGGERRERMWEESLSLGSNGLAITLLSLAQE